MRSRVRVQKSAEKSGCEVEFVSKSLLRSRVAKSSSCPKACREVGFVSKGSQKYKTVFVDFFFLTVAHNVLQLPEGGDFEALHCQPSTNFDRSTKLDYTTEPPLLGRCCYAVGFLFLSVASLSITAICPCLNGRTFYCPVTTINATVTLFWL